MSLAASILERTLVYRMCQVPFAEQKSEALQIQ